MNTENPKLTEIERRLEQLERAVFGVSNAAAEASTPAAETPASALATETPAAEAIKESPPLIWQGDAKEPSFLSVTKILGWGGATALVLAAAYLIRLAIEGGWLTPTRQIGAAILGACLLVSAGIRLKNSDREYASLLPAGGVVVFFLAIYGAHLYYGLIGVAIAGLALTAVCILSLFLCRYFGSQLYALFAVVGSYSAPFLLGSDSSGLETFGLISLIIYYSCWSVLFSVFSVWNKNRIVYLLALYLALIGFDFIWKLSGSLQWPAAALFQLIQLLTFSTCAVIYAIRVKEPMSQEVAFAHAPALFVFYSLQYALFDEFTPGMAQWVAVGSAAVLLLGYFAARRFLTDSLIGSRWLLSAYCALVLLHAGYLESVPDNMGPWVALILILVAGAYRFFRKGSGLLLGPIGWSIGLIYAVNYVSLVINLNAADVPAQELLLVLFAVQIYIGFYFSRKEKLAHGLKQLLIYSGHIAAMSATLQIVDNQFMVSLCWGGLALIFLVLSLRLKDKLIGQSALLFFVISAIKVLIIDLTSAAPLIRVLCLLVLGVTLYIGGWMYRKVDSFETAV